MRRTFSLILVVSVLGIGAWLIFSMNPSSATAQSEADLQYEVNAENPRLNRKVVGEVVADVQGMPAEPVHSFVWDGDGSVPIEGTATLEIDPVGNTGEIKAQRVDENGTWEFRQTAFAPPHHPTGLRTGPSADSTILVREDPVPTNVYLHGDTTAGGPVLPTIFNHLATWGPAELTLDGEPFDNPFDGPAPLWVAHTMTTVGVRNDDGTVRTVDGGIFNPVENRGNGAVDNDDLEFHLVFHDAPGPEMTNNFPPPLSFFYHVTFEDVKVEMKHSG